MNPRQTVTFITSDVMIHLCENTELLSQHVSDGGISHLRAVKSLSILVIYFISRNKKGTKRLKLPLNWSQQSGPNKQSPAAFKRGTF